MRKFITSNDMRSPWLYFCSSWDLQGKEEKEEEEAPTHPHQPQQLQV